MKGDIAEHVSPEAGGAVKHTVGGHRWALFPIPIRVPTEEIEIQADRRLAFQVITAFGASAPGSEASTRVLSREGNRLLVEFRIPMPGLFGGRTVHCTVEYVALHEPDLIEFEGVAGPIPLLQCRFVLEERGACTRFRYESTFGVRGWVAGWLIGVLLVRPMLKRFMRQHMEEMKESIEARARRSKVYPQRPCDEEEATNDAAR